VVEGGREGGREKGREGGMYERRSKLVICPYLSVANARRGHTRRRGSDLAVDVGGNALGQLVEGSHL